MALPKRIYFIEGLGVHSWQPEWITYYRQAGLWEALYLQQHREYVLGEPTRIT
jgi:hypothetical protein